MKRTLSGITTNMYYLTMYNVLFIWAFIGMYNWALFGNGHLRCITAIMYYLTMYNVLFIWSFIGMYNLALFGNRHLRCITTKYVLFDDVQCTIYLVIYWNVQLGIVWEWTPAVYYRKLIINSIVGTPCFLWMLYGNTA